VPKRPLLCDRRLRGRDAAGQMSGVQRWDWRGEPSPRRRQPPHRGLRRVWAIELADL